MKIWPSPVMPSFHVAFHRTLVRLGVNVRLGKVFVAAKLNASHELGVGFHARYLDAFPAG